jgi:hypothetical protein
MMKKKNITGDLLADACATAEGGKPFFPFGFELNREKCRRPNHVVTAMFFWGAWI